jgi:hypothetical protein
VDRKNLNARRQNCHADKVKLIQPSPEEILEHTTLPASKLDGATTMYAGVAKTLMEPDDSLESVYKLCSDGSLVIPVRKETVRGLILVFTQIRLTGSAESPTTGLIASTDPEIKNTTTGTE